MYQPMVKRWPSLPSHHSLHQLIAH